MLLRGTIEIYGMMLNAIVTIEINRKGVSRCQNGRYRAYKTVNGVNKHLGYYDNEQDAARAAALGVDLRTDKRTTRDGIYQVTRPRGTMWQCTFQPAGMKRLRLGEYATRGAAILVRDIVARRCGGRPIVESYEMPLAFVTNPIARSFIRDPITPATEDDIATYNEWVDVLNGSAKHIASRANILIPTESWRLKQPTRTGKNPFDTLEI